MNILQHIIQLLPPFLRKQKMIAWLYRVAKPLRDSNTTFVDFRDLTNYNRQFTGQVISLEERLNQQFSPSIGGIYITTNDIERSYIYHLYEEQQQEYIYHLSENQPPRYIYHLSETASSGANFTVHVPSGIYTTIDLNEMKGIINLYRLPGKQYEIVAY